MFELIRHATSTAFYITAAIILLLMCCVQSHEANIYINRINEENASDPNKKKLQTAPYVPLIIVIILLVMALVLPMH